MIRNAVTVGFALFGALALVLAASEKSFVIFRLSKLWFDISVWSQNKPFIFLLGLCSISVAIFSHTYFKSKGFGIGQNVMLFLFGFVTLLLFCSTNIFTFLIFFELTSLFSYGLIRMAKHQHNERAARIVLTTTLISGLGLIYSISWLHVNYNLLDIRQFPYLINRDEIPWSVQLGLVFGIIGKSPLFPLGFWLVSAMAAESPVSAYLHSATLVKLGLYAGWILSSLWLDTTVADLLLLLSSLSAVYYSYKAFYSDNLKIGLAYSTLGSLAILCALLAQGQHKAFTLYLVSHGVYKSTLFVIFGVLLLRSRNVSVNKLGIAFTKFEKLFILAPVFTLLGLGPVATSQMKKQFILDLFSPSMNFVASLGILGAILYSTSFGARIVISLIKRDFCASSTKGRFAIILSCVLVILTQAYLVPISSEEKVVLTGIPHLISYAMLIASLILAFYHPTRDYRDIDFNRLADVLDKLRSFLVNKLQSEKYSQYLSMLFTASLVFFVAVKRSLDVHHIQLKLSPTLVIFMFLVIVGTLLAVRSRARLKTVLSVALLGLAVNLSFLLYGAPDLALTSFFVDILWLALFTICLSRLPPFHPVPTVRYQTFKFTVALFFGITMFLLALEEPTHNKVLKREYLSASGEMLNAKNAVNAIVTGFRAFDTLGEILVLALCGFGFAMLFAEDK